jgi:hypothetical protein
MRHLIDIMLLQLVLMPLASADDVMGRLFFTPGQRQHLERLRIDHQQRAETAMPEADGSGLLLAPLPEQKIQGYVKRNDAQQSTIWLNGKVSQSDSNHALE